MFVWSFRELEMAKSDFKVLPSDIEEATVLSAAPVSWWGAWDLMALAGLVDDDVEWLVDEESLLDDDNDDDDLGVTDDDVDELGNVDLSGWALLAETLAGGGGLDGLFFWTGTRKLVSH